MTLRLSLLALAALLLVSVLASLSVTVEPLAAKVEVAAAR